MQVKDILRKNYLAVSTNDVLSGVFGKLGRGKHTEAVIMDDKGRFVGMLDKRALIRSRIEAEQTKVQRFVAKTATLTEDMPLEKAAHLMHSSDFHVLPVLDKNKKVIGIAGARDVLDELQDSLKNYTASEIGTMKLIKLNDSEPVAKAVTLFHRTGIDHIPLVDDAGKLSGIVSFVDLVAKFHVGSAKGAMTGRNRKHGRTSERPGCGGQAELWGAAAAEHHDAVGRYGLAGREGVEHHQAAEGQRNLGHRSCRGQCSRGNHHVQGPLA